MLTMGILNGALGPLLVEICRFYRLELADVGLPILFDGTGYLLGTVIVSFVWKIHRARFFLSFSSLALCLVLVGILPLHDRFGIFLVLLFLLGFSFGFLTVALDALFSEIYRKNQARYLNILHFFFGVGSFLGPLLTVGILRWMDRWVMFYVILGLCHVPLVMIFPRKKNYRFTRDASETRSIENRVRLVDPLSSFIFWVILLAMFLHLGIEVSFSAWVPLFLVNIRNLSVTTGSYAVSLFWLAFLVGRALYARFSHRIDLSLSLIIGAGGAALLTGLTFLGSEPYLIFLCAGCAGLLLSCIYPNLLALGGSFFPRHIGFIMGTISASGGVGYMFFPWLIGPVSQYFGLATGVFMIPLLGLSMMGILIVLRCSERERLRPADTALS